MANFLLKGSNDDATQATNRLVFGTACTRLVRVRIVGHRDAALNNTIGTCGSWKNDTRRYVITLDTGRVVQVNPSQLQVVSGSREHCAQCPMLIPPSLSLEGKNAYQNPYYRRLIYCCGKALCSNCDPAVTTTFTDASIDVPMKCVMCSILAIVITLFFATRKNKNELLSKKEKEILRKTIIKKHSNRHARG